MLRLKRFLLEALPRYSVSSLRGDQVTVHQQQHTVLSQIVSIGNTSDKIFLALFPSLRKSSCSWLQALPIFQ